MENFNESELFIAKNHVGMTDGDSSWSGVPVLVTGADGFIGSHLTESLVNMGAEVRALAQYNSFDTCGWLDVLAEDVRDRIEIVRGDIRDAGQMSLLCRERKAVFHLAALISIPFSYDAPSSYIQTNVQGTANVLGAAMEGGAEKIIHTSTSEVYGTAITSPIAETHPLQGQSPYSASKIGADMIAQSYYRAFGAPVVTLRPFNTYGPRQSERAVLPTIVRQAIDPACGEIRLGDLNPRRDFCFVADTVNAFIRAAETGNDANGETFNAGTGRMVTIGDAVETVRSLLGSDKPVLEENQRKRPEASEVMALQADYSAFEAATGWRPETDLESGLGQLIDWWRGRDGAWRRDARYIY